MSAAISASISAARACFSAFSARRSWTRSWIAESMDGSDIFPPGWRSRGFKGRRRTARGDDGVGAGVVVTPAAPPGQWDVLLDHTE